VADRLTASVGAGAPKSRTAISSPDVTVIVCTHQRPADLARCLDALCALDDQIPVIVVDSASQPSCRELVGGYAGRLEVRYAYEPRPGLSRARNRGVELAETALVAFIDDDAMPHRDWARRITAAFGDERVVCAGGTCSPLFGGARPAWLSDRLLQFAGITRIGDTPRRARSSMEWPFGANICFRRSVFDRSTRFDERLGRIGHDLLSGEESALIEILVKRGHHIRLEPAAIVDHTVASSRLASSYYWRRLWWAGVTRARAGRSARVAARLMAAAFIRLGLYLATGDRIYLYRLAETAGYLVESCRP
jgi:glucosyl-dolichyl phosphate glucuronosyltransferase